MSAKSRRTQKKKESKARPRQFPWHWLAWGGAAIILLFAGILVLDPWSSDADAPTVTPQVAGAPRLMVDRTSIDEGYVKYDAPIRTTFRLSNVGDRPLEILGTPQVSLVRGC